MTDAAPTRLKPGQHVLAALRHMIVTGELPDGGRIAEIPTAERLGVSRMPVRTALRALEQEGLVVRLGARGYAARAATPAQVEDAIAVRGALEGLAAGLVAARADRTAAVRDLAAIVATGDRLFDDAGEAAVVDGFYRYNLRFHDALVRHSGNEAIAVALARNDHLPLASAAAMIFDWRDREWERAHLSEAHRQHREILAHIAEGRADEAERRMRDHARMSLASVHRFERLGLDLADVAGRLRRTG